MRRSRSWLLCLGIVSMITACHPLVSSPTSFSPTEPYNPFATLTPILFQITETSTSIRDSAPTFMPEPDTRTQYELDAVLDYEGRRLSVAEEITYRNNTDMSLENLILAVESNHWADCFHLDSISSEHHSLEQTLENHTLDLRIDPPLGPDEVIVLEVRYTLILPFSNSSHVFGVKSQQINLVDWYPFVVPYREGWLLHPAGAVGEHLVYEASDFTVRLSIHPAMSVAASAPLKDGIYHLESGRSFALSISPGFQSLSTSASGIAITSFHQLEDQVAAEMVLAEAERAMTLYSHLFGDSSYLNLNIVESEFYDGMEYDGLIFIGENFYKYNDGTKLNYLVDLVVHEIAHQWWFGNVGNDQALEPWLDESLSTYSEYLFYESNYPGVAESWWSFRQSGQIPTLPVDQDIYSFPSYDDYRSHAYLMGSIFLHDLRATIGEETFFGFLYDYATQMDGQIATASDFFRILDEHATSDIDALIGDYFGHIP